MDHRRLGSSGLRVSCLAYGNWVTHGDQIDAETATATIHAALDAGITTFDTADVYAEGRAESILGDALRGQRRDGLEIMTKVYWPTGSAANDRGLSRKHIVTSCEESLRRLGTDYLDVYQAHRFDHETPLEETLRAFDDLVRQGKVLHIGVSEWTAQQIRDAVSLAGEMGLDRIVSNQPQYSMLYRVPETEVIPACEELGIGQVVWSPMAQGVLTGKYLPGQPSPGNSRASGGAGAAWISNWLRPEVLEAVQRLAGIARGVDMTLPQFALAWVLSNSSVACAIVGASRPEQIRGNAEGAGRTLPHDVMTAIDEVLADVVIDDPRLTRSPTTVPTALTLPRDSSDVDGDLALKATRRSLNLPDPPEKS